MPHSCYCGAVNHIVQQAVTMSRHRDEVAAFAPRRFQNLFSGLARGMAGGDTKTFAA